MYSLPAKGFPLSFHVMVGVGIPLATHRIWNRLLTVSSLSLGTVKNLGGTV